MKEKLFISGFVIVTLLLWRQEITPEWFLKGLLALCAVYVVNAMLGVYIRALKRALKNRRSLRIEAPRNEEKSFCE